MSERCPKCGTQNRMDCFRLVPTGDGGETWERLDACRIRELEATVAERDKRIAELEAVVVPLERLVGMAPTRIERYSEYWVTVDDELGLACQSGADLAEALAAAVKAMEDAT